MLSKGSSLIYLLSERGVVMGVVEIVFSHSIHFISVAAVADGYIAVGERDG